MIGHQHEGADVPVTGSGEGVKLFLNEVREGGCSESVERTFEVAGDEVIGSGRRMAAALERGGAAVDFGFGLHKAGDRWGADLWGGLYACRLGRRNVRKAWRA